MAVYRLGVDSYSFLVEVGAGSSWRIRRPQAPTRQRSMWTFRSSTFLPLSLTSLGSSSSFHVHSPSTFQTYPLGADHPPRSSSDASTNPISTFILCIPATRILAPSRLCTCLCPVTIVHTCIGRYAKITNAALPFPLIQCPQAYPHPKDVNHLTSHDDYSTRYSSTNLLISMHNPARTAFASVPGWVLTKTSIRIWLFEHNAHTLAPAQTANKNSEHVPTKNNDVDFNKEEACE